MLLAQAMRVQPTYAKLKHQKPNRNLPACSFSILVLSFTQPLAQPLAWAHQEDAPHQHRRAATSTQTGLPPPATAPTAQGKTPGQPPPLANA
jgi:hypothetical protein